MVKQKTKADWQRRLEEPGWRISKAFDRTYATVHGHTPWYEEWLMAAWAFFVIAFVIAIPVAVIAVLVHAFL